MSLTMPCPRCDAVIDAEDEDDLVAKVQRHVREDGLDHTLPAKHILARLRREGPATMRRSRELGGCTASAALKPAPLLVDRMAAEQFCCKPASACYSPLMASTFVTVQTRGTLALPADVRRRHQLDKPGAQVEVVEREDGVIELHPQVAVPADQAWFWTERAQAREREVDALLAAGEVTTFDSDKDFLAHLGSLADE